MHSLFLRLTKRSGLYKSFASPLRPRLLLLSLLVLPVSPTLLAQSAEDGNAANAIADELEKNLESEREELENVLRERETMLAEQAGIRDQLAEQQKELEEKMDALMELCEQHNAANASDPIDCEKEVGGN